jgi:predicted nucleic acid-binding protein
MAAKAPGKAKPKAFVIDPLMAAPWIGVERYPYGADADLVLERMSGTTVAKTSTLFWHEIREMAVDREKRRSPDDDGQALIGLARLRSLPIEEAGDPGDADVIALSLKHRLGAKSLIYLALAIDLGLPLATLNWHLAAAARREKVSVLGPFKNAR